MADRVALRIEGRRHEDHTLVLAHGAGAPMDSPFLETIAAGLVRRGVRVVRFEFPYMARRRAEGGRRPPDREPALRETWHAALTTLGARRPPVIGGKSLGGRIASLIADEAGVAGLVCLGYPFHPPGRPERLRTAHLARLRTPALIVQGSRDPFGTRDEIAGYRLASGIRIVYAEDGDHSLRPRKASGRTEADNLREAIDRVAAFVHERTRVRAPRRPIG